MNNYENLLAKLDEFIRKYYKNQMIKGAIYSVGLILAFFLLILLLESLGRFSSAVRTVLFFSFLLFSGIILVRFFAIPLSKMFRLGKTMSREQASQIIGKHFPEVQDKLLNTLQLKSASSSHVSNELLQASIDQRISTLKPVPFTSAIDFSANKKYLKWAAIPVGLLLILSFAMPSVLSDSASRLVRYNEEIVPQAPYAITLVNNELEVAERDDFFVQLQLSGQSIPDKIYIELNGNKFKVNKDSKIDFSYTFRNVQKDTPFRFFADGFYSDTYTLKTLSTPLLQRLKARLIYPNYLGLTNETIENTGDLTVPQGTRVTWEFSTRNTQEVSLAFPDTTYGASEQSEGVWSFQKTIMKDANYSVITANDVMVSPDSMAYLIQSIPDQYPAISVKEERDSVSKKHVYFTGEISDDHGFTRLGFFYQFADDGGDLRDPKEVYSETISIPRDGLSSTFFHHWNMEDLGIKPGEKINYHFKVWDNDGVNGAKSAKSASGVFEAPSLEELEQEAEQDNQDIKEDLKEGIKEAKDLQKELEELRKDMLEKEELTWQEKKRLEELLEKQKNLQEKINDLQDKNQEKDFKKSEFEQPNESMIEKQKQLQKLFDEVMDEDMKKLYEEMEKLMEEMDKDELQKQVEEMNLSNEDIEKELDRALEQFKQMEWEMKMEKTIDKVEELAEKQKDLAKKSEEKDADSEDLQKEQEKLNEEFEKLKEEMEELEKMNEELENPNNMPDTEEQQESIEQDMKESSEQLSKDKKNKASESQQDAGDKMEQMAQDMQNAMAQEAEEQMEEDLNALRALLENIITLSFDQETVMSELRTLDTKDPKYVFYGQQQRKLKDDARMVEDSLFALSKRIPQISSIVNREINAVNDNMGRVLEHIGERQTKEANANQQYVMTSFNNLALLLDEALKQMQQQMAQQKPGQGNCNKPGGQGKKPSASQMKKMQDAMTKQLEKMKGEKGKNPDGKQKPGGQQGMSEQIAKMAAQQAAIRREVEKMGQQLNEDGTGEGNGFKKIAKEMEEVEKDIVNQRISEQTLQRQQDILTRLLKAENAEREREMDEKRKSQEAKNAPISNPERYLEYQKRKEQEVEMLKTLPPTLKPYYKAKVNEYFNKLGGT